MDADETKRVRPVALPPRTVTAWLARWSTRCPCGAISCGHADEASAPRTCFRCAATGLAPEFHPAHETCDWCYQRIEHGRCGCDEVRLELDRLRGDAVRLLNEAERLRAALREVARLEGCTECGAWERALAALGESEGSSET